MTKFEIQVNDKIDDWKTNHPIWQALPMRLRLERFAAHFRDERINKWCSLSDKGKGVAITNAFKCATELDLQRFRKISHWNGKGIIPMSVPEWVMLIIERNLREQPG